MKKVKNTGKGSKREKNLIKAACLYLTLPLPWTFTSCCSRMGKWLRDLCIKKNSRHLHLNAAQNPTPAITGTQVEYVYPWAEIMLKNCTEFNVSIFRFLPFKEMFLSDSTVLQHANHTHLLILCGYLQTRHASAISRHLWFECADACSCVCRCFGRYVRASVLCRREAVELWGLKGGGCVSSVWPGGFN